MPVPPGAIDRNAPIALLLAPARPLPAAPSRPQSNRPATGDAVAPRAQVLQASATAEVRGPIGSVATVGPNGSKIGAPGISGIAAQHAQATQRDAVAAIGRNVDARA